jgi:type I restriction enzyme S subunit
MNFQPYGAYRPSPISWLDLMPQHWGTATLRWMSRRYAGGTPDKGNEAYWEDGDIPWLNSGAVNDGYITQPSALITREGFANSSAKWIPKDALVMALAGQGKTKGMVAQLGIETTCNQSMAAIIPDHRLTPRYLYWWLSANYQNIRNMAGGEARDGLNLDMLGSIPCPLPPLPEQEVIARFLDAQTARIDTLAVKKRELIDKLKEKRSALIARTVTRGLPPDAARPAGLETNPVMKDSGVEWLGETPAHWQMKPVKHLGRIGNGSTPARDNSDYWEDGFFPWLNSSVVNAESVSEAEEFVTANALRECHLPVIEPPAVLVGITGQGRTRGMATTLLMKATINQHVAYIKPDQRRVDVGFLRRSIDKAYLYLRSESDGGGSTKGAITCDQIANLIVPLPPIEEQQVIAAYLDRETAQLDALTAKVESAITRLTEYRQSLITAAVTGKIDLRGATA